MNAVLKQVLDDKRAMRKRLAALPFAQKIAILEQLRERGRLIASSPLRHPADGDRIAPPTRPSRPVS